MKPCTSYVFQPTFGVGVGGRTRKAIDCTGVFEREAVQTIVFQPTFGQIVPATVTGLAVGAWKAVKTNAVAMAMTRANRRIFFIGVSNCAES
jgi:hypothetical protein